MARASGVLRAPLGHEARHDPEPGADLLGAGLEQDRAVRRLERLGKKNRRLVNAGPGLGVQPFDGNAEVAHLHHERLEELAVLVGAQQRVAEHARGDGLRTHVAFLGP